MKPQLEVDADKYSSSLHNNLKTSIMHRRKKIRKKLAKSAELVKAVIVEVKRAMTNNAIFAKIMKTAKFTKVGKFAKNLI